MSIFTLLAILFLAAWFFTGIRELTLIACIFAVCNLFNDDYRLR